MLNLIKHFFGAHNEWFTSGSDVWQCPGGLERSLVFGSFDILLCKRLECLKHQCGRC